MAAMKYKEIFEGANDHEALSKPPVVVRLI